MLKDLQEEERSMQGEKVRSKYFSRRITLATLAVSAVMLLNIERGYFGLPSEWYVLHHLTTLYGEHDPSFLYTFNEAGILYETGKMNESTSPFWWLDSGGALVIDGNIGKTLQGSLPTKDRWRRLYGRSNPVDTDEGYHPQNIFRLISRARFDNVRLEGSFRVTADHFSKSGNRNESNGLLLMTRYADHDTFYYAGIRVDGTAAIKKKYHGIYYPMAQVSVFPGIYNRLQSPSLLPHDEWLGVRIETYTHSDTSVSVRLFLRREGGEWEEVLEAQDNGSEFGGTPPIRTPEYVGIRTDFMDVEFDNFHVEKISIPEEEVF